MALTVYDLTSAVSSEDARSGASSITSQSAPDNVTYTWIAVRTTATNFTAPSPPPRVITNSASPAVPADNTSRGNAFSATSRLQSSIALPLPKNVPYAWQHDWSQGESGFFQDLVSNVADGSTFKDVKEMATAGLKNAIIGAANKTVLQKFMQKNYGAIGNPFKEIYYNGVNFRNFTFTWDFAPANIQESRTLEELIYQLELASHPELLEGDGLAYVVPDTFDITFVGTRFPRIQTAALTSMNVEYGQNGPKVFSSGHAGFVELQLSFTELIPITKKEVKESHAANLGSSGELVPGGV